MIKRIHIPRPPLSAFVASFWLYDGPAPSHARERLLPTGTTELVINLRADALHVGSQAEGEQLKLKRGAIVCGPHSEFFVIDAAEKASVLTAHVWAGGAFPFLGMPAAELHNTVVSLDTLWGSAATDLRERLLQAPTPERKFALLEQALLARAARSLEHHPALRVALCALGNAPHTRSIAEVSAQLGYSTRRLEQLFDAHVGLTPKRYQRVQRFQAVLRAAECRYDLDWARVALASGYFDQAHFNHDFLAFSGLSPGAYLEQSGPQLNHLPI